MAKIKPYLLDVVIIALFVLLPGIRGYDNWAFYEYAVIGSVLVGILYSRHCRKQNGKIG